MSVRIPTLSYINYIARHKRFRELANAAMIIDEIAEHSETKTIIRTQTLSPLELVEFLCRYAKVIKQDCAISILSNAIRSLFETQGKPQDYINHWTAYVESIIGANTFFISRPDFYCDKEDENYTLFYRLMSDIWELSFPILYKILCTIGVSYDNVEKAIAKHHPEIL